MNISAQAEQAAQQLNTIQDLIRWSVSLMNGQDIYFGHGTDNPWDEARLLITHALNLHWDTGAEWFACQLTLEERRHALALVVERVETRTPAPYLLGQAWFCGRPYQVDERVLIPRSPIGEMIQQAFQPWWLPDQPRKPARILDLCTGSGCIGLACAHAFPDAAVELMDISFDALAVAEENIQLHDLAHRVMAVQSDLFAAADGKYDVIVSNPPYVDAEDMASLPQEYHHEPELALAAGDDGLDLVRIILAQAKQYLAEDGLLVVEVGNSWPALEAAFPELPFVWPDFQKGGHGVFVLKAEDLPI